MEIENIKRKLPENVVLFLNFHFMIDGIQVQAVRTDETVHFIQFRARVKRIYEYQRSKFLQSAMKHPISATGPGSVDRRGYLMSFFDIVSLEATRSGTIKSLRNSFPKFVLSVASTSITVSTLKNDVIKILKDFSGAREDATTEYLLRQWLYDPIFDKMFPINSYIKNYTEFYTEWIDERYIHRAIDAGVAIKVPDGSHLPMIFIEVDKHELDSEFDHKDVVKISVIMGAALKKILGVCRKENLEFLRQLCVFGILAGDTVFDMCVAYPDFGDACESEFSNDQPFPPYSVIFRYSKDMWRFDFYRDEKEEEENDMSHRNHPDFQEFFFESVSADRENLENHFMFKIIPAIPRKKHIRRRNDHGDNNNNNNEPNLDISHVLEAMDLDDLAVEKHVVIDRKSSTVNGNSSSINLRSVNVLIQISEIVKNQAKSIKEIMGNPSHLDSETTNNKSENEKFVYNSRISLCIPHGRDNFKKVSPNKDYTDLIDND